MFLLMHELELATADQLRQRTYIYMHPRTPNRAASDKCGADSDKGDNFTFSRQITGLIQVWTDGDFRSTPGENFRIGPDGTKTGWIGQQRDFT